MHEDVTNVPKPRILLYNLWQTGLIILCQSGVVYQNQTCGYACIQRTAEGVLVPLLDIPLATKMCPLYVSFDNLDWDSKSGISQTRAVEVDGLLSQWSYTSRIRVDRSYLDDSAEAWVYVTVTPDDTVEYSGFGECKGILTWPNSD